MQDQNNTTDNRLKEQVQEDTPEQTKLTDEEQTQKPSKKDWFDVMYKSALGILAAIGTILFYACIIGGGIYWIHRGYVRLFSTDYMMSVGERGHYYDLENACFVKPYPNRRVLKGCKSINYNDDDTICVAWMGYDKYRYVNMNSLTFINETIYSHAGLFREGSAIAYANDSIYRVMPDGSATVIEKPDGLYTSIEELEYMKPSEDDCDYLAYREISTGIYMYKSTNGRYGLMSSEFVRLTEPLFADITAQSESVFFCEYFEELGVLMDKKGKVIK